MYKPTKNPVQVSNTTGDNWEQHGEGHKVNASGKGNNQIN